MKSEGRPSTSPAASTPRPSDAAWTSTTRTRSPRITARSWSARTSTPSSWPHPITGTPRWRSTPWSPARTSMCEKPMCHTIDEARRITRNPGRGPSRSSPSASQSTGRIRSGPARPTRSSPRARLATSSKARPSYYRNSAAMGQWRYYPLVEEMNPPSTIDLEDVPGGPPSDLAPDQPFNRAKYAQWRCYWDFGGGMYTDLFVHQLTHLMQAMGAAVPARPGRWAPAASIWNTMAATCPTWRRWWPTMTRVAR